MDAKIVPGGEAATKVTEPEKSEMDEEMVSEEEAKTAAEKEKTELAQKNLKIKKLDSFSDKSGRRLRILRAQGPVIQVQDGISDSLAYLLFGRAFALFMWKMVDDWRWYTANIILCLIGLTCTIVDITTPSSPVWITYLCLLLLPFGIIVVLLLKLQVLKLLLTTFNVWFLVTQAAAMMICIILVAERPIVTFVVIPPVFASVFVDAFPQEHRNSVTGFTYLVMLLFTFAFDIALMFKLLPLSSPLSFNVNDMEFSGKALAFGCSMNLGLFILRNVYVMIVYPDCLTMYAANLRSSRFSNFQDPEALWQSTLQKSFGISKGSSKESSKGSTIGESEVDKERQKAIFQNARKKMVWILRPVQTPVILETRDTIAAQIFGKGISAILWGIAKNPISFLLTIPGVFFMLPLLEIQMLPKWTSIFSWLTFFALGPGLLILNVYLAKKLLLTFQVWFLLSMSVGLLGCWYTEILDVRIVTLPVVLAGMVFSIVLDAYPGGGRFLAGVRFYFFKITLAGMLIGIFLVTDAPLRYFQIEMGELTFAGSAICVSCAFNLVIFGLRNMYVLLSEPECLVVINCLMQYAMVPQDVAWKEISSYE